MNRMGVWVWMGLLVGLFGGVNAFAAPDSPGDFDVTLALPDPSINELPVGEPVPLVLTVRNTSSVPILFLPVLDGSFHGRYPRYVMELRRPLQVWPADPFICGMFGPLREEDFLALEPGQTHSIPLPGFFVPLTAGVHEVAIEVSTDAEPERFAGEGPDLTPELEAKLRQIPRKTVRTNTLRLNVVSNGKTLDPTVHCLMGMPREEVLRLFPLWSEPAEGAEFVSIYGRQWTAEVHLSRTGVVDRAKLKTYDLSHSDDLVSWLCGIGTDVSFLITPFSETETGQKGLWIEAGLDNLPLSSSVPCASAYK